MRVCVDWRIVLHKDIHRFCAFYFARLYLSNFFKLLIWRGGGGALPRS
jgi:hypothetical protein